MQWVISGYDKGTRAGVSRVRPHASLKRAVFPARIEAMRSEGLRQSDRINFRMRVEATWFAAGGVAVKQTAQTLLVSRNGGVLCLAAKGVPGQGLALRQLNSDGSQKTR